MTKAIDRISRKPRKLNLSEEEWEGGDESSAQASRMPVHTAPQLSDPREFPCIVCAHVEIRISQVEILEKYHICEEARARGFIEVASHMQDDVYT